MAILHTVNKSPFDKSSLEDCLSYAKDGSTILLFEDGIYAAMQGTKVTNKVKDAVAGKKVCVLGPDLKARGMSADRLIEGIEVVGYDGFVDLVEASDKVQSWL